MAKAKQEPKPVISEKEKAIRRMIRQHGVGRLMAESLYEREQKKKKEQP